MSARDSDSAEAAEQARGRGRGRSSLAAAIVSVGLCLGCCALAGIVFALSAQVRVGGTPRTLGFGAVVMDVCVGTVTQPRVQTGVGWQSPYMSVTPPAVIYSPNAFCVGLPAWPPFVPLRGEWMFPP